MDRKAMYKLSYGLFILTAKEAEKDNGCIINTAIQAASEPNQLSICVNKANYTHDMIQRTGKFTVSVLSQKAQFELFTINEQISNFAQTYPTNLKASSNEALLFMRRYRFANCSCFSCCFKDAYPSSNVQ